MKVWKLCKWRMVRIHPGKVLREVRRGIPKCAGKSLGADKVWYRCVEETKWNKGISSWQIRSSS